MTAYQATAEVFVNAFRALPKKAQSAVLFILVRNSQIREDIIDLAIAEKRMHEKSRPFKALLSEIKRSARGK